MTNGRPICYTLCSDQALETYLCSHLEDVEVAVIRIVVCKGSDVVEHQLCVGAEITVQADGDVVPEYPAHKKKAWRGARQAIERRPQRFSPGLRDPIPLSPQSIHIHIAVGISLRSITVSTIGSSANKI